MGNTVLLQRDGYRIIGEDKRDYISFEQYHAQDLREEMGRKAEEITELLNAVAREKIDLTENRDIALEVNTLYAEQAELRQEILNRYIASFKGKPKEILTVYKEILEYVSVDEFKKSVERRREYYGKIKAVEIPSTEENIKRENARFDPTALYAHLDGTEENFENFVSYLYFTHQGEVETAYHYGLWEELEEITKEFASRYYAPPKEYNYAFNAPATNALAQTTASRFVYDETTGQGKMIVRGIEILKDTNMPEPPQATLVFWYCLEKLAYTIDMHEKENSILEKREMTISVNDYMKKRGISDRKSAVSQLVKSLNYLYGLSMRYEETSYYDRQTGGKLKKPETTTWRTRIIDAFEDDSESAIVKRGKIKLRFNTDLLLYLTNSYLMDMPDFAYKINGRKYPYGFKIIRKLAEHMNMNIGKENEGRIAVSTLLKDLPEIPTYEEVMEGNRHITERIIDPVENTLNALAEEYGGITWHYCNSKGKPLTDKQLEKYSYKEWITWLIEFELIDYPELEERREEVRAIREAKKRGKLKAIERQAKKEAEKKIAEKTQ